MAIENLKNLPRLYVPVSLIAAHEKAELSEAQAHYLRNVLRKDVGDRLRIFNGADGEWLAEIKELNKKKVIVSFVKQISSQKIVPDITVAASPVKKEAFDYLVEKSSELGAVAFVPVICARTIVGRVNTERLEASAIESAEQSERCDVMHISEPIDLDKFLNSVSSDQKIIFCFERGNARPIATAVQGLRPPLTVLIGPEGGFTPAEVERLLAHPCVVPVSLGPRILRADTAAAAALACVQAIAGDWNN